MKKKINYLVVVTAVIEFLRMLKIIIEKNEEERKETE